VIYITKRGAIFCVILLLLAGFIISPAIGSFIKTDESEHITLYFWDLTGKKPLKKEIDFTDNNWNKLSAEIQEIRATSSSIEESLNAQFTLFKQYGLISYGMTYQILEEKAKKLFESKNYRAPKKFLADNVIINAICAIDFELNNGTTFVFGLNTFINYVGFNIVSFHKGYSYGGINTKGLMDKSTDSGEHLGFMFGLLGYWLGTKTGTGIYSELTVAGFTVFTTWIKLSD